MTFGVRGHETALDMEYMTGSLIGQENVNNYHDDVGGRDVRHMREADGSRCEVDSNPLHA